MERMFLRLVSMSLSAGWLVLAVLLLRLLLKKAPRRIVCLLWALVALRLVVPAQISWRASLMPSHTTVEQAAQTTLARPDPAGTAPAQTASAPAAPINFTPGLTQVLAYVWLAGVAGMLLWAAVSDARLRLRLRAAHPRGENVWLCDRIDTPFVLGVFFPHIYLPPGLNPAQREYVLAHERAHIARGDHVWKPLGWLLLSVYWFQPLLWLAYMLLCRDLELACDERVARGLDRAGLAAYAEALLDCGCRRRYAPMSPVAFGEVSVKARVKAVLHYQKPAFLRAALAMLLVAAAGAFFLTEQPVKALQHSEQDAVPEEAADVIDPERMWHPDDYPPEPKESAAPETAPASSGETSASTWAQTQYTAPEAVDPQAQIDEYIRQINEENARRNQEAAARNGGSSTTTLQMGQATPLPNSGQTQTVGPQSALNVQPTTPQILVAGADSQGNVGGGYPNVGAIQNGNTMVIRLYP